MASAGELMGVLAYSPAAVRRPSLFPSGLALFLCPAPTSSNLFMSSRTINLPLYFPNPVTQLRLPSCRAVGEASTSDAGIFKTSEAESTINPESLPLCSTTRIRFRFRSEEHTSELQSLRHLVCRLLLE